MQHRIPAGPWAAIITIGFGLLAVLGYLGYRTHDAVERSVANGAHIFSSRYEGFDFIAAASEVCVLPMANWRLRMIMTDSERPWREAISAALHLGVGTGAVPDVLKELAQAREDRARYFAYEELVRLGHDEFVEPMLAGLNDSDVEVRGWVASWAAMEAEYLPLDPVLRVLRGHGNDADAEVRELVKLAIERLESRLPEPAR